MRNVVTVIAAVLVLAAPARSQMQMSHEHHEGMMQAMEAPMGMSEDHVGMCIQNADKLGLTDDQVRKLTPVHREMQKKTARLKADQKIAEIELMEIMEVKDFDLDKALAASKKISAIREARSAEMFRAMKEVRSVLTDEQFRKMRTVMMAGKMHTMKHGTRKIPAKTPSPAQK